MINGKKDGFEGMEGRETVRVRNRSQEWKGKK